MRLLIMIVCYLAVMAAALGLLDWLLDRAFPGKARGLRDLAVCAAGLAALFPLAGAVTPDGPLCWFFQRWGNVFIGYFLYFFGPLLLVWLFSLPVRLVNRSRARRAAAASAAPEDGAYRKKTAPWYRVLTLALLVLTIALNLLGTKTAHDVKVTRYELPKETLAREEPLRIVLIADLHIGVNSSPKLYEDMAARVNEQDPDLILVAGDIVTSSFGAMETPDTYAKILRQMRARYGAYAVYGNHDVDEPLLGGFTYAGRENALRHPDMPAFIEACGWQIVEDETVTVPELGGLVIAGRRDASRPGDGIRERDLLEKVLKDVPQGAPVLLLGHEPAELEKLAEYGVGLTVSGHTHDGQIFPGNIITRILNDQSYGLMDWNGAQSVVTSGVGFYGPPIRVATVSEIVVIDLK